MDNNDVSSMTALDQTKTVFIDTLTSLAGSVMTPPLTFTRPRPFVLLDARLCSEKDSLTLFPEKLDGDCLVYVEILTNRNIRRGVLCDVRGSPMILMHVLEQAIHDDVLLKP